MPPLPLCCSGVIIPPGSQSPLPTFWSQLTGRALFVGLLVGALFLLLTMRLALAAGFAPNLQVVIAGACWGLLRLYTLLLGRDMTCIPVLNAQEVSVAAAAALAVASTAAAGGFGSVLLALQDPAAQRVGSGVAGNLPSVVWSLAYGKVLCYLLLVVLSGALLMLAFRKPLFGSPAMTFATGREEQQDTPHAYDRQPSSNVCLCRLWRPEHATCRRLASEAVTVQSYAHVTCLPTHLLCLPVQVLRLASC